MSASKSIGRYARAILWAVLAISSSGATGCNTIARVRADDRATPAPTALPAFTPRPTSTRFPTVPPLPTPTPGIPGMVSGVVTTTVNLRMGPGAQYPVVTKLAKGATVTARGRDETGEWFAVLVGEPPTPQPRGTGAAILNAPRSVRSQGWVNGAYVEWQFDPRRLPLVDAPPTPYPTPTRAPTLTPQPTATPRMYVDFRADTTIVAPGACTFLRWDVEGVQGVYLDGRGQDGHGALEVCTRTARTFVLHIIPREGAPFNRAVTIGVNAPAAPTTAP